MQGRTLNGSGSLCSVRTPPTQAVRRQVMELGQAVSRGAGQGCGSDGGGGWKGPALGELTGQRPPTVTCILPQGSLADGVLRANPDRCSCSHCPAGGWFAALAPLSMRRPTARPRPALLHLQVVCTD